MSWFGDRIDVGDVTVDVDSVAVTTLPPTPAGSAVIGKVEVVGTVETSVEQTQVATGVATVSNAGTRVQLPAQPVAAGGAYVKAEAGNSTGKVYVGGPNVTAANGYELAAGEQTPFPLRVQDLSQIYLDGSVSGVKARWIAHVFNIISTPNPDEVWRPLSALTVVNPVDFGAVGNGSTNDLAALQAAHNALPAGGGIIYFPPNKTFRKNALWTITKDHVKLWAPASGYDSSRVASINAFNSNAGSQQAIFWSGRTGAGVFGLKLASDANGRGAPFEDNMLMFLNSTDIEVEGSEIFGARATGMTFSGTSRHYVAGNYIHHTQADCVMRAYGSDVDGWVWDNFLYDPSTSQGDDGVSCVTDFGDSPKIRQLETWANIKIGGGGRGYSVIGGGPSISIHDNWAIGTKSAGLIVASEASFNSETVNGVVYMNNVIHQCCVVTTSHTGILISGGNPSAAALSNIAGTNNISSASGAGSYRTEGSIGSGVTSTGLTTSVAGLTIPTVSDAKHRSTTELRTRDVSHVGASFRPGLYRIHVRGTPGNFQQRFEYVIKGSNANLTSFVNTQKAAGAYLAEQRTVSGTDYALLLSPTPIDISTGTSITAVTHQNLRDGATRGGFTGVGTGALDWLWTRIDSGNYV